MDSDPAITGRRFAPERPQPPARLAPLVRGQLATIAVLLVFAAIAWVVTDLRMAGMDAGPGADPGAFGFYISTWVVMMAAMMFPSAAPMVLMYRSLQRGRRTKGASGSSIAVTLFLAGYLAVWGASGLLAYAALKAGRSLDGGFLAWDRGGRWTVAAILLAAAVYEFTPLKNACLGRCRSPVGFLLGSWRDGPRGALRMGIEHGGWCLGCCWMLMVALFALGAMSLVWMIVISVLIAAEKLVPWREAGTAGVAAVLAALAIGVASAPGSVPALTVPGSASAMRAMSAMHGMGATHGMSATHGMGATHSMQP
jgi:predicted metal-binding membrane protein